MSGDNPIRSSKVYTPLGLFLEKTQIVELPQLFYVLLGKLSFIGNRPTNPNHTSNTKGL